MNKNKLLPGGGKICQGEGSGVGGGGKWGRGEGSGGKGGGKWGFGIPLSTPSYLVQTSHVDGRFKWNIKGQ